MQYKAVIHLPKAQEDAEKLRQEVILFRAEKTIKLLLEQGVTHSQLTELLKELHADL